MVLSPASLAPALPGPSTCRVSTLGPNATRKNQTRYESRRASAERRLCLAPRGESNQLTALPPSLSPSLPSSTSFPLPPFLSLLPHAPPPSSSSSRMPSRTARSYLPLSSARALAVSAPPFAPPAHPSCDARILPLPLPSPVPSHFRSLP
eukprot:656223-Rhodomonas_salina.1